MVPSNIKPFCLLSSFIFKVRGPFRSWGSGRGSHLCSQRSRDGFLPQSFSIKISRPLADRLMIETFYLEDRDSDREREKLICGLLGKEYSCILGRTLQALGEVFCVIVRVPIRDILVRIRIRESVPVWWTDPCLILFFSSVTFKKATKKKLLVFLPITVLFKVTFTSFFKDKKWKRILKTVRIKGSYYFLIEGSGSGLEFATLVFITYYNVTFVPITPDLSGLTQPFGSCKPAMGSKRFFSKALREPPLILLVLLTCYWSVHFLAFMTCTSVHPSQHVQATFAKVSRISGCLFRWFCDLGVCLHIPWTLLLMIDGVIL